MPVHIPAAPGFNGWTKLKDRGWKTMVEAEVEEMRLAIEADRAACGHPGTGGMPDHETGSTGIMDHESGRPVAYTYQCRSGSRWFNPVTRQMEGHAHCTCDGCF